MTRSEFSQPFSLKGQTALITGGGSGLGLSIAQCMVQAGARVVLTGRRAEVLEEAVGQIGTAATGLPWDITRLETLPELIKSTEEHVGPLSILVNNAGTHLKKPAVETSDSEVAKILETHVSASFALAREAAGPMLQRKKGNILFIGSMAGVFGIPKVAAYSAAKAAVVGLTRALATEWSSAGVRVNAIVPGWIDAGMAAASLSKDPPRKAKILSRTPMECMGEPDDIGWAAVYLCSPAAKFVTGTALVVDGGAAIGF